MESTSNPPQAMSNLETLDGSLNATMTLMLPTDSKLISDDAIYVLEILFYVVGCGIFSAGGIVANTINIIVFAKQGLFTESSNVSLFALAVSDICSLVTLFWITICISIVFSEPKDWSWVPNDVWVLTGGLPHVIFAQVTCWITAYIAFERCMCVMSPFKMRTLFTAKRTAFIIPVFFVYNFACYTPLFMTQSLRWMKDPVTNKTRLVAHNDEEMYESMQALDNYLNSFANRLLPIAVVLFCTTITALKVKASKRWRENVSARGGTGKSRSDKTAQDANTKSAGSDKEDRLVRMITLISLIFLLCYSSDLVMVFFKYLLPDIQHNGKYNNLFHLAFSIQFFLEGVNSSINIFVYYNMSSRYRQELRKLMGWNSSN